MSRISALLLSLAWLIIGISAPSHAGTTLDKIKASATLTCGVNIEEPEYSTQDAHGNHAKLDVDICKAVAVAVLGPDAKFTVISYRDEQDALKALRSGEIALLATGTPNYLNSSKGDLGFARPIFYDYQALFVNKTMGIASPQDLTGKKICFLGGTEIETQLTSYMQREKVKFLPFPFEEEGEMEAALVTRNCAAVTADVSQLGYERLGFKSVAKNFEILPDVLAKDPLAPTYRLDDPQWATIVNWTMEALIQAEESGITQSNLAEMQKSDDEVIRRLLGTHRGYGQFIGLDDAWAARVIGAVGNYGEMYERDLGAGSIMKLPRGANKLWTQGGLMYAMPIR